MEEFPMESAGLLASLGIGLIIFSIVIVVFMIICYWIVAEKANKPGWSQIIPIWNWIVLIQIAKKPEWWIILFLIPIVNLIFIIIVLNGISKNFGHGAGFTVGLFFLGIVFWPILAFGNSKYVG